MRLKKNRYKKWKDSEHDQKLDQREIDHAAFAEYRIGHHYTIAKQYRQIATNEGQEDITRKSADKITQITEQ